MSVDLRELDEKIKRMEKEQQEGRKRINKLIEKHDPNRGFRFQGKMNGLQIKRDTILFDINTCLDVLQRKLTLEQKTYFENKLQRRKEELKKVEADMLDLQNRFDNYEEF